MVSPIEFYFDFSSPYGFFAAQKIDRLASRNFRTCIWKPFLLGIAFKKSGMGPLMDQPLRGEYATNDWKRMARYANIPWKIPKKFPVHAVAASRTFYWLHDRSPEQARLFGERIFNEIFCEGRDVSSTEIVVEIASDFCAKKKEIQLALQDQKVKDMLKKETDQAIEKGVFGSPFFIVDGEGFWGCDRLWMLEEWIQKGGW